MYLMSNYSINLKINNKTAGLIEPVSSTLPQWAIRNLNIIYLSLPFKADIEVLLINLSRKLLNI